MVIKSGEPLVESKREMAERCEAAARVMERKGWIDGTRHSYDGRVCVIGAFEDVYRTGDFSGVPSNMPACLEVIRVLRLRSWDACGLAEWSNTSDGPTVIAGLTKTANVLRREARNESSSD